MSAMIITDDQGVSSFYRCACDCMVKKWVPGTEACNEKIPTYYSKRQAYDIGWKYTDHRMFCPPEESGVWVCPECAKDFKWEVRKIPRRSEKDSIIHKQRRSPWTKS